MWQQDPKSECPPCTLLAEISDRNGGACAHEGPKIGVDPHKASVALAAVDEHAGEFLEHASFPQSRAGLRALERFKPNGSPSVVGRWRTPVVSAGTWRGGWQRPESPWWTWRPQAFGAGAGSL